jgi:hypothetical protein
MSAREAVGRAIGGLAAPLAAEASLVRGARVFHPDGVVYAAEVSALAGDGPLAELGRALQGAALVRFSGALRRYHPGKDPRDLFGAAVRFHAGAGAQPTRRSQDLLFATFRRLWQIPLGILLTDPRDFLANDYHAVLPFQIPGGEAPFTFCLTPERCAADGRDRYERLEHAVASGHALLRLDARLARWRAPFTPVATIALRERAAVDQEALRFDPFRAGAGIVPVGLSQAVRAAVYPASQLGRAIARGPGDHPTPGISGGFGGALGPPHRDQPSSQRSKAR